MKRTTLFISLTLLFCLISPNIKAASPLTYDASKDIVEGTLASGGIKSTVRIEIRSGQHWLIWEYAGPKPIVQFVATELQQVSGGITTPFRHAEATLSQKGEKSIIEYPLFIEDLYKIRKFNFIRFFYKFDESNSPLSTNWRQRIKAEHEDSEIYKLLQAHQEDVIARRYPSRRPHVKHWTIEELATLEGAVSIEAPALKPEIFSSDVTTPACSRGLIDTDLIERESPNVKIEEIYHNLNCHKNKRDYAPGHHAFTEMVDVRNIGIAKNKLISTIIQFEDAGPNSARYLSNLIHCKRLIMKRCGRGCYKYEKAFNLFDDLAYWEQRFWENDELQDITREIRRQLSIHQKRFPVIFNQNACPTFLMKRVPTIEPN